MGLIHTCTEIRRRLISAVEVDLGLVLIREGDGQPSGLPRLLFREADVLVSLRVCYGTWSGSGLFWVPRCTGSMGLEVGLPGLLPGLGGTGMGLVPGGGRVGQELVAAPGRVIQEEKVLCGPIGWDIGFVQSTVRVVNGQFLFGCSPCHVSIVHRSRRASAWPLQ